MVLTPKQVTEIKEYADTESDNSKTILDLIDTISYLSELVKERKTYPCEYISRDVSKCKPSRCIKVECALYK